MAIADLAPLVKERLSREGLWDEGYDQERRQWFLTPSS